LGLGNLGLPDLDAVAAGRIVCEVMLTGRVPGSSPAHAGEEPSARCSRVRDRLAQTFRPRIRGDFGWPERS
jgi:hypothetical protein